MENDVLDQFDKDILDTFGYEVVNGYVRQRYSGGTMNTLVYHVSEIRRIEIQEVPVIRDKGDFDTGHRLYITISGDWYVWTVPLPPSRLDEIRALAQAFLKMRDKSLGLDPDVKYHIQVSKKSLDPRPVVNW